MQLPEPRIGPYVRALATGLNQLAPHGDYVPLMQALAHLRALDPALSGDLLLPAEVSPQSGMPAYPWMQRAMSERVLSAQDPDPTEEDIARAARLDPALGRRLAHRRSLRVHLRESELLPATHLACEVRRMGEVTEISGAYDRQAPDGRWLRIRFVVRGPGMVARLGPFQLDRTGRLTVDPLLQHLFTLHFSTPLLVLREQLGAATQADVVRLSRSWTGPFWFPGIPLPPGVPPELGKGLLLHLASEVVAEDVHHGTHLDPLLPPSPTERAPEGQRIFRERRFAGSAAVVGPLQALCDAHGMRVPIASIEGRTRPRAL